MTKTAKEQIEYLDNRLKQMRLEYRASSPSYQKLLKVGASLLKQQIQMLQNQNT